MLSRQGDISLAYEMTLPELFTLGDGDYDALHAAWVKAIRNLPTGAILHKQDWYTEQEFQPDFEKEEHTFFTRSSDRHFNERPYLEHRCFIFITMRHKNRKAATALNHVLFRSISQTPPMQDAREMNAFFDKVGQFVGILEDSGLMKARRLSAEELSGSEKKAGLLEQYCFLLNPQQPPLLRDISFVPDFRIGNQQVQIFTLADVEDLPATCSTATANEKYSSENYKLPMSFAAPLGLLLNCNHIYNQYVFIEDAHATIKRLEAKRLRLQSLSAYSRENTLSRDAVNEYLNEAIGQQRLPVKAHFNVLAWSDDELRAKEVRSQVSSALAQLDARAKEETMIAPQLFIAGFPGGAAELPAHECFETFAEQASTFFNKETCYQSTISPVGIRFGDRLTGRPLHVDISDWPVAKGICQNRSKFIIGPSGSGKSFLTNHLTRTYYEQGSHVLIVDVGHSYRGLCEFVGGYYFTYSIENPIRFNPFFLGGEPLDTEKKESIKTLLLALWKKETEPYSRSEYISLSNALSAYFSFLEKNDTVFPCFDSFYEFLRDSFLPGLRAQGVKDKHFDIDNFLYVLRPYYADGEFSYLLNAKENLNLLEQRFIVFELDNIKDHQILFSVTTLIIMQTFIDKMRRLKGIRKMILIEEAWKAIAKEGMSDYIKYLFKTVRKFYGEAVVITQEVDDIIGSSIIKDAIVNNSDCKILLDQSKYQNKFQQIQDLLGLTDKERALVLSLNKANDPTKKYKEVFISLGGTLSKVYRTEVSLEEYLTYTTEEREKIMVQAYTEKYGSIRKGISVLAEELRHSRRLAA